MDSASTGPGAGPQLVLEAGDARVVVLPASGGRIGSVRIAGLELLVEAHPDGPMHWGSYPMAPWAGRIRHGRFTFDGVAYQLPLPMPPHAIHGVVYDRPWDVLGPDAIAIDLDGRWPFRGRVTQRFALDGDSLTVKMTLDAAEPQPVVLGWHPWFRRVVEPGAEPLRLEIRPATMLVRDGEGIVTGERGVPPPGPWDDCFTDLRRPPVLRWPRFLELTVESDCLHWVVYTMPEDALCVEPQTAPPDALNSDPTVVLPGRPLVAEMTWRWRSLAG